MDSLTQIVLGAAVGEAVLGEKVGNKAVVYGAIAGTVPDLDVISSYFVDHVTALSLHRGFSHSILFAFLFSPILGYFVSRFEQHKVIWDWTLLFFVGFVTHSILDSLTTWGTQLLWPYETPFAFDTIFIVDPFYTLPFLVFLIAAMFYKRKDPKRRILNRIGLVISCTYLLLGITFKVVTYQIFTSALQTQNISYQAIKTRPSPMNFILWSANVETADAFLTAHYSVFDSQPITFERRPKNHQLLPDLMHSDKMKQMIIFTQGWFDLSEENGRAYFHDLRSGTYSFSPDAEDYVFTYEILENSRGELTFNRLPPDNLDIKAVFKSLVVRLAGN